MNEYYDKQFLSDALFGLKNAIEDLGMWSVYNDDIFNGEVGLLQDVLEGLENDIKNKTN